MTPNQSGLQRTTPGAIGSPVTAPSVEKLAERTEEQKGQENQFNTATSSHPNDHSSLALINASGDDFANAFLAHAVHLGQLHSQLQAVQHAAEPAALQEFLGKLFPGVNSLTLEAERAELRTLCKLSSTLEGMLKKLLEQPKLCTTSTLNTTAAALALLDELSRTGSNPDLANPPIRLLVVDDDPVARRAISGSLQFWFWQARQRG